MRGEFYENMVKPMKEKLKTYFKELSPVITCAAALNPTLNRFGVETLIEKISYDLGLFEEDPNHIVNQCARFNDAFDKMFQVYLTKYDSSSTNIHMYQDAGSSSHGQRGDRAIRLYNLLRNECSKRSRANTSSSELERYEGSDFVSQLTLQEFENFDILGWWKEWESQFPVLATMARDLLTVQASTVALESAFSVSGRVISPRRTKLTPLAVEVCICLKDHLDSMERIQNISPLEGELERVEEEIHAEEIAMSLAVPLTTQELKEENELYNEDD
ncbi:zinc finger BED domain-containing protein RICESLEEPER 2-like protein [Tanacetum coccineum]